MKSESEVGKTISGIVRVNTGSNESVPISVWQQRYVPGPNLTFKIRSTEPMASAEREPITGVWCCFCGVFFVLKRLVQPQVIGFLVVHKILLTINSVV